MLVLALGLLLAVPVRASPPGEMQPHALRVGKQRRVYYTFVPSRRKSKMTVVSLHGLGGDPHGFVEEARLREAAEQRGFLLVSPKFAKGGWVSSDRAFLRALKARVVKDFHADPGRFFALGVSNGGLLALALACESRPLFRGYAAVLAHLGKAERERCRPRAPLALLHVFGEDDPVMTFSGELGKKIADSTNPTPTLGAVGTDDLYARLLRCGQPVDEALVDHDPSDGTAVARRSFPCPGGSALRSVNVKGGGHTWPGGMQYLPPEVVGRVSREFSAAAECLDFFEGVKVP